MTLHQVIQNCFTYVAILTYIINIFSPAAVLQPMSGQKERSGQVLISLKTQNLVSLCANFFPPSLGIQWPSG